VWLLVMSYAASAEPVQGCFLRMSASCCSREN